MFIFRTFSSAATPLTRAAGAPGAPRLLGTLLLLLVLGAAPRSYAQGRFMTKEGRVSFFSTSIIEDIEAINNATASIIDLTSNQFAFVVPIKEFTFKRTLMQEHFNENYMESDKYPRATFTGRFVDANLAQLATPGSHTVRAEGDLTLHGVTRRVAVPATLELKSGQLQAFATFNVAPADYNIEVPLLVRENIAKIVRIRVVLIADPVVPNAGRAAN
ncbi:YceI family protein [Hymenobacter actinosclerus]|uniref:Polyisoprenoid-binding protein YceI n=1 Tax=Hymenobacter actinosclerus TaxID=82805 RepID=A0A1I0J0P6_9BACT|nr:YceI family protein [Hymenobacter actinosclerus]SEU03222.1 Polyisoprenoid-binding protein YceI [Hymenobacter actinosclerus]